MKQTLTIEFDEDGGNDALKQYAHLDDVLSANWDTQQMLRSAIKHGDYDDKTVTFLESLRETLYVEGLEQ